MSKASFKNKCCHCLEGNYWPLHIIIIIFIIYFLSDAPWGSPLMTFTTNSTKRHCGMYPCLNYGQATHPSLAQGFLMAGFTQVAGSQRTHGGKRGTHWDLPAKWSGSQIPMEWAPNTQIRWDDSGFGCPGPSARPAMRSGCSSDHAACGQGHGLPSQGTHDAQSKDDPSPGPCRSNPLTQCVRGGQLPSII